VTNLREQVSEPEWLDGQTILDDYVVVRQLGEGGMGCVYLVESDLTGQQFAVKKAKVRRRAERIALLSELQTWVSLPEHPHIAAFRFFRSVGDDLVIFSEYVKGASLDRWLAAQHSKSLQMLLDIAVQAAWGLAVAHRHGVVHQDVKPGNYLVSEQRVVKVTDFGLARLPRSWVAEPSSSSRSDRVTWRGYTSAFCSPEQADGQRLTPATDVWSWGLTMLWMFVGEVTWCDGRVAGAALEDFAKHPTRDSTIVPMPASFVRLLDRCFERRPEKRWESMGEVADEVGRIYQQELEAPYVRKCPSTERQTDATMVAVEECDATRLLTAALRADNQSIEDASARLPHRVGTPRARLIADIAALEETTAIYERLLGTGRDDLAMPLAEAYHAKAALHKAATDFSGALGAYHRSTSLLAARKHHEGRTDVLLSLAAACFNHGKLLADLGREEDAIEQFSRAVEIYEPLAAVQDVTDCRYELARALINRALSLNNLGKAHEAINHHRRGIELLGQLQAHAAGLEIPIELAQAYMDVALSYQQIGELDIALRIYQDTVDEYRRLVKLTDRNDIVEGLARTFLNQAATLRSAGRNREAVEASDSSIDCFERLVVERGDKRLLGELADSLVNKANASVELDLMDQAVSSYDRAISIYEELVFKQGRDDRMGGLARAYANCGAAHLKLGQAEHAIDLLDRSIDIYEQLISEKRRHDLVPELAGSLTNRATLLLHAGRALEASALYRRAVAYLETLVFENRQFGYADHLIACRMNNGLALESSHKFDEAIECYQKTATLLETMIHQYGRADLQSDLDEINARRERLGE